MIALVIFYLIANIITSRQYADANRINEDLLINIAEKEARNLEKDIELITQEARVLSLLIENSPQLDSTQYDAFIFEHILDKSLVFGMGYWFEPYYYDGNKKYYGPYIYKNEVGELIKTMHYSSEDYDYHQWAWYRDSFKYESDIHFTEPYYDEHLDTMFMTASSKINRENKQVGVVTIDITLREFSQYLTLLDTNYEARSFILTAEGLQLSVNQQTDGFAQSYLSMSSDPVLVQLDMTVQDSDKASTYLNADRYFAWAPIGDTGMRLVMEHSRDSILGDIDRSVLITVIFFVLALIILLLMTNYILTRRIELPLKKIIMDHVDDTTLGMTRAPYLEAQTDSANDFDKMIQLINKLIIDRRQYTDNLNQKNIQLRSLLEEVENGYIITVRSLSNAIEAKDKYTRGHCDNVTNFSLATARKLGVSADDLSTLEYAALLHDVGKIGIPSSILNKPGKLTNEEYDLIKEHSTIGYEILKDIDFLRRSAEIVYQHHERIDGNGYPRGLTGDQLDILTKIITIADAYDAMTSVRAYRLDPLSHETASDILRRESGTQFDGHTVEVFLEVVQSLRV